MQHIFPMRTLLLACAVVSALGLAGCNRAPDNPGPAERAGKAIDDAGARVGVKVQEQVDKAEDTAQAARERAREATRDASRNLDKATEAVGKKVERAGEKIRESAH